MWVSKLILPPSSIPYLSQLDGASQQRRAYLLVQYRNQSECMGEAGRYVTSLASICEIIFPMTQSLELKTPFEVIAKIMLYYKLS